MTRRTTRIKRHAKAAEAVIRPTGDVGLFRVNYPDGTASEPMTLGEAREMMKAGTAVKRRLGQGALAIKSA